MEDLSILRIFAAENQLVMFKRAQVDELKQRILETRNKIQVISGPRQVGKSTMVKQALQDITIPYMLVSADNIDHTNTTWIGEIWATARARMKAAKDEEYLLVIIRATVPRHIKNSRYPSVNHWLTNYKV